MVMRREWLWYASALAVPWVLFAWAMPFVSEMTIGRDYTRFGIDQQLELMFSVERGSFPLYAPGFAGGNSASALTLAQLFHPVAHLARLLPGYWLGLALEWNTALRLATLALAHMALFSLLRRWRLSGALAFSLSLIAVYNLRGLDLFRYGPALESWTGHLFLCAAIGHFCADRGRWRSAVAVILATAWLIASGHPQMAYLGGLGAALFALLMPGFCAHVEGAPAPPLRVAVRLWLQLAALGAIGLALAGAYAVPFYFEFLASGPERTRGTYAFANQWGDTLAGTINNWVMPLRADAHGAFGGYSLQLAALLAPAVVLLRVRPPGVVWWALLSALLVFACIQGDRAPVHWFAWNYLPMVSLFRGPTRFAMLLPVLLMVLSVWLVRLPAVHVRVLGRRLLVAPAAAVAGLTAALSLAYWFGASGFAADTTAYTPRLFRIVPYTLELVVLGLGLISLGAFAARATRQGPSPRLSMVLIASLVAQGALVLSYGTWIETKKPSRTLAGIAAEKQRKLDYERYPTELESAIVLRQIRSAFLEPVLAQTHERHANEPTVDAMYARLAEERRADTIVLLADGPDNLPAGPPLTSARVTLELATFNRLEFKVAAAADGHFALGYPYSPHWRAWVDGEPAPVLRGNGASLAVAVDKGLSAVEFRYWSHFAAVGMALTCLVLAGIGIESARRGPARWRLAGAGASVVLAALLFGAWYASLYTGAPLGTAYAWDAGRRTPTGNIAFGMRTEASSQRLAQGPKWFHPGRAVDGDRRHPAATYTLVSDHPFWGVDLARARAVRRVVLHEGLSLGPANARPLVLSGSTDGESWFELGRITAPPTAAPLSMEISAPALRHLRVHASGTTMLGLREVEIFE